MKKLISGILLAVTSLNFINGLSFVESQENIETDKFVTASVSELTKFFGEPIYKELSRQSSNSIVLNAEDDKIQTLDSYKAIGILKDVGNVTDISTFTTTYGPEGNSSTSIGKGIIMTSDGEIATYTGHDLGITYENGTQTYHGIQIFSSNSKGELSFLDNLVGLYEYKYPLYGENSGMIGKWK